jgi:mannose-6-phosphate isomerase-like protein (cupin superfamily)
VIKTKIRQRLSLYRVFALAGLVALIVLGARGPYLDAQSIAQGFRSDATLERGAMVIIDPEDDGKITAATLETVEDIYGVVINPNDASVTLSEGSEQTFVATSGRYQLLVSDQNGPIQPGDFITISSLEGIGMRVNDIAPVVVGRALAEFDGSNAVSSAEVGETTVAIGRIAADIQVGPNPLQRPTEANLPEFLRRVAETVAGKPVSAIRVYIAMFVFIVSAFVAGSLMYSGVRSSIISIGRNPLSKKSIIRGMVQVILVGMIIFMIGVFGVYFILRL